MSGHIPSFFEVFCALVELAALILLARFGLRWFLGVSALKRCYEEQSRMLAELARQQGIELKPLAPVHRGLKASACDRLQALRALAARIRSRVTG
ncbi:hypothetical protein R70006_06276 [Paraburkholderia domus]|uniref:hypothetical protein n=1 Tax=Paraburkholderia domus TaxID=2793075 RepID=UPI001911F1D3|nr:hypothetical protein [Paraburkholderia domus]MBK5052907.1 hypothetical protein [Burkholderia sp. R-70006]CAE6822609.1 hypothetical protein R70006_06276 [Paraburkholderia domus]